jgi:hypothetical protein
MPGQRSGVQQLSDSTQLHVQQGSVSVPFYSPKTQDVGALIGGGDFQGLGIARSLGRPGMPACISDDQYCLARFSRCVDACPAGLGACPTVA